MSIRSQAAAKLAAVTRKLIAYGVAMHKRSLEAIVAAAKADTGKAYKRAEEFRTCEDAARQLWNQTKAERIKAVAAAVATSRTNSYTISAANAELARYNA